MKWVRVLPIVLLVLLSTVTATGQDNSVTKVYGDFTLPAGGYLPETWDLNDGPITVSYTLDLTGAPNVAYTGSYGQNGQVGLIWWNGGPSVAGALMTGFLADWDNAGTLFPTFPDKDGSQDIDDKFNLQHFPDPGTWDEAQYDVVFGSPTTVYADPIGSYSNYGIWFDRDGVDPWQATYWGMVDGGTYNTGGIYHVQLTFAKFDADTGIVQPLFFTDVPNDDAPGGYGVPTGFNLLSGGGCQYFPAGISFQADETKMAAMRVLVQGSPGAGSIVVRDLTVIGHPSDTPVTSNVVADPNPVPVNGSGQLSAIIESKTDVPPGFAEYSLDGSTWSLLGDAWVYDELSEVVSGAFAAPATPGIYNLCVRATDNYWNRGEPTCVMLVVYDPDGGFVTGGGWIDSAVNPDVPYMQVGGKASFGFVAKYKKGTSVPEGNTEFVFNAGNLKFHSTSYDWLLVTGSNYARFKGTGTIDGMGEYKFMIWAGDGTGSEGTDTFRIKIWEEENTPLYDNGLDQAIGGGSIVVHTK